MLRFLKKLFRRNHTEPTKKYSLIDTFGCTETPPQDCPTFLERQVHRQFRDALDSYNIIVVYGESRQGKTWTIERYCPMQLRIGCNAGMTFEDIKAEMLHAVKLEIVNVEHTITDEVNQGETSTNSIDGSLSGEIPLGISAQLKNSSGMSNSNSHAHTETIRATYSTIDLSCNAEFIDQIKSHAGGKYFVFDNFHYLQPTVQQHFCSLLKEFNYHGIKVIIVGVWKDASRITSLAPDLVNRCQHIDIGAWSEPELLEVAHKGETALNITIGDSVLELFIKLSANNIGIFKDFLQKYCQKNNVNKTAEQHKEIGNDVLASSVSEEVINEAYKPLHDRLLNLALPQREKKGSKHMRQKMVISILNIIKEEDAEFSQSGISITRIKEEIDCLCSRLGDVAIDISNLTQELGLLHLREENRQTSTNFIPLFFYDKANKKLLVLEPTIYEIRAYSPDLIENIIEELKTEMRKDKISCVPMELEQ